MNVLIVEDEASIARRIMRLTEGALNSIGSEVHIKNNIQDALQYIEQNKVDLVLLDLNLNGEDGFKIIAKLSSYSFHTIVISANTDRAIEAFNYGVLDFVSKPINKKRFETSIEKYFDTQKTNSKTKYLAVRNYPKSELISVNNIYYLKGAGAYSELFLKSGKIELHSKSLDKLFSVLPDQFLRIHKSYIVNLDYASTFIIHPGSKYELKLKNDDVIPVSRKIYKTLKDTLVF